MSRARRSRARLVVTALGILALVIVGFVTRWNPLSFFQAWRLGYYVSWAPTGFVPSSTPSRAKHLAQRGIVAGDKRGGNPDPQAAIWNSRTGEIELIDSLPGTAGPSSAESISESGRFLIGTEQRSQEGMQRPGRMRLAPFVAGRAWRWSRSAGLVEISGPGGVLVTPLDVNERGDVCGATAAAGGGQAFLWTKEEGFKDLGVPGFAMALNEDRAIVGTIRPVTNNESWQPFIWSPEDGIRRIAFGPGFSLGQGIDVNERGEVLVTFWRKAPSPGGQRDTIVPFLWTESAGLWQLPVPRADIRVRASALNDRGDVLLSAEVTLDPGPAFLLRRGELVELPALPGAERTHYETIDNRSWLLGRARFDGAWRGFVAEPF